MAEEFKSARDMFMTFWMICLALLTTGADDLTLEASVSDGEVIQYGFTSALGEGRVGMATSVVTEKLTNHMTGAGFVFSLRRGEKGYVPPAEKQGGRAVPRSLTLVRTTYRPLMEASDAVSGTSDVKEDF